MKKLILCLAALLLGLTAFAQSERTMGVRAGLNIVNIRLDEAATTSNSRPSFHAGFAFQQPFSRLLPLYLESGVYISGRGGTIKFGDSGIIEKSKFNMLYLQVPAGLSFHIDIKNVSIQPLAGIYYGYGLYGRLNEDGDKEDLFAKEDGSRLLHRSDFGLRFGFGVAIKKVYVGVGYDHGLLNIDNGVADTKLMNRSYFLSIGYNF